MTALNLTLTSITNLPSPSGSYTFSVTQQQIIRQAMIDIGALEPQEQPTAQEYSDCSFKLNMMVKQWMGNTDFSKGLKVWTRKRGDLFLGASKYAYNLGATGDNWVASTTGLAYPQTFGAVQLTGGAAQGATVLTLPTVAQANVNDYVGIQVGSDLQWTTISAVNTLTNQITLAAALTGPASSGAYVYNYTTKAQRPLAILTCVLRDSYSNDTPMNFMTTERYESLPTKTAPTNIADPAAILYESQWVNTAQNGILYLDVAGAQDVTKHLHCVYLSATQDFVNPGDSPDYPQQWYRPLVLGHARDIAGMFDCEWTKTLEANYQEALAIAQQADPDRTDVFFEPYADNPYGP